MVDLKNCPFCGSSGEELMMFCDPEEGRDNSGPSRRIQCAVCNVEAPFYPSKAEAIAAWNRRALQAVGPEPAVAGREKLNSAVDAVFAAVIDCPHEIEAESITLRFSPNKGGHNALFQLSGRIRSALVATPPAEPVVEALREYADPRNWVVNGRFDPHSGNFDGTSFAVTALATKPAVKDSETVVALPPTREYVDRIVRIFRDRPADDTSAFVLQDYARAALSGSGPGWPVPDGWKLVPVEPDDAMIEAGQDTCEEKNCWGGRVYASDIWESMLAACPAAPQQGGE